MAELLQNREQNIEHVGIYIAEHRKQFPCIAGALVHLIAACGWALSHAILCDALQAAMLYTRDGTFQSSCDT